MHAPGPGEPALPLLSTGRMARVSDDFVRRTAVVVGMATGAVLLALGLWVSAHMLLLVFGGVLLAILLRTLGDLLGRLVGLRQRTATWIVIVLLAGIFGLGGWYLSAELAGQFDAMGKSFNAAWEQVVTRIETTTWGQWILGQVQDARVAEGGVNFVGRVLGALIAGISGLVISIFIGLYVAADPRMYHKGLVHLVPVRMRKRADEILMEIHETLRWWLTGTFALMITIGILTFVGLWLLGIPLALSLAVIAFALEFIPYVGPILAAVPAVLVASTVGPQEALYVVLLYWGIQSLEGYVLSPLIFQKSLEIPPMLTLSAQVVMGTIFGILGVIFAMPLTACAMVLVRRLYVEDTLGDQLDC